MSLAAFELLQTDPTTWGNPPAGYTYIGVNRSNLVTLRAADGTLLYLPPSTPSYADAENTSGQTDLVSGGAVQTTVLSITGAARTVPVILPVAGIARGSLWDLRVEFAPTAGLALELRLGALAGTLLDTYTSNGNTLSAHWRLVFNGTTWKVLTSLIPATS